MQLQTHFMLYFCCINTKNFKLLNQITDMDFFIIDPAVLRHEYIELLAKAHKDDRSFMDFIPERILESQMDIIRLLHIPFSNIK